jgi:type II secretory pathway pseudopilin PulG
MTFVIIGLLSAIAVALVGIAVRTRRARTVAFAAATRAASFDTATGKRRKGGYSVVHELVNDIPDDVLITDGMPWDEK